MLGKLDKFASSDRISESLNCVAFLIPFNQLIHVFDTAVAEVLPKTDFG